MGWAGNGFVFLTKGDRARLQLHTGKRLDSFAARATFDRTRFTDRQTTQWFLKSAGGKCHFFKEGKCGVYNARPTQCRTFPHWPEVHNEIEQVYTEFCPGVGKGEEPSNAQSMLELQKRADFELRRQSEE